MSIDPYAADLPGPSRQGRLGIGVISAGRVGAVAGSALQAAGHHVVGVHAVSAASRERAERMLPDAPILDVPEILRRAELILLAVPDDALPSVVSGAAEAGHFQPGHLVVHTSGRFGTGVLMPAQEAGAIGLAIHPAMTFTGTPMDLQRLSAAACAVTAPEDVLPVAQALVVEMGAEPVVVADEHRATYHAALAHASNHLNTITAQAAQLLEGVGVERPSRLLGPLMQASLDNALASGESALTGPVARGDVGTVRLHVARLSAEGMPPDILAAYTQLATSTAQRALASGRITHTQAAEILDALKHP
ncbi:Rossmann-like and DUF2520 domain-containing protein [Nesterenkonia sp. NBAIMH1]|uniref:Rossmann-like and DUF2520 domain-containing protein n=1 Tax=Nesterenkonia sp. NBAIMH1 TaxID=2600320 RepID=UPI001FEE7567|nr:DUF2520 domain-containing protein [Nesterenkonia sp. NBAIMH1]